MIYSSYFESVIAENQALCKIEILREHSGAVVAIGFQFDRAVIYFTVNADDDTLLVSSNAPVFEDDTQWGPAPSIFNGAIGKRIQWYWEMGNNQGYSDGFQFEFMVDHVNEPSVSLQLVAIASRLSLREVKCANF